MSTERKLLEHDTQSTPSSDSLNRIPPNSLLLGSSETLKYLSREIVDNYHNAGISVVNIKQLTFVIEHTEQSCLDKVTDDLLSLGAVHLMDYCHGVYWVKVLSENKSIGLSGILGLCWPRWLFDPEVDITKVKLIADESDDSLKQDLFIFPEMIEKVADMLHRRCFDPEALVVADNMFSDIDLWTGCRDLVPDEMSFNVAIAALSRSGRAILSIDADGNKFITLCAHKLEQKQPSACQIKLFKMKKAVRKLQHLNEITILHITRARKNVEGLMKTGRRDQALRELKKIKELEKELTNNDAVITKIEAVIIRVEHSQSRKEAFIDCKELDCAVKSLSDVSASDSDELQKELDAILMADRESVNQPATSSAELRLDPVLIQSVPDQHVASTSSSSGPNKRKLTDEQNLDAKRPTTHHAAELAQ